MSITEVRNGDESSTVLDTSKYRRYPFNSTAAWGLLSVDGNNFTFSPDGRIAITGTWGRYGGVPEDIKHAAIRLASFLYVQRSSQVFDTLADPIAGTVTVPVGMPRDVTAILKRYRSKKLIF